VCNLVVEVTSRRVLENIHIIFAWNKAYVKGVKVQGEADPLQSKEELAVRRHFAPTYLNFEEPF